MPERKVLIDLMWMLFCALLVTVVPTVFLPFVLGSYLFFGWRIMRADMFKKQR